MGTSAKQRRVLQRVLEQQPCSLRRLAEEAGVDHAALLRAASGERNLTPEVAAATVKALQRWGELCNRLAQQLENATQTGGQREQKEAKAEKRARRQVRRAR